MRGMEQWKPFNSLLKESDIYFLEKERLKVTKPIISKDKIYEIDIIIRDAIKSNKEINLKYFINNFFYNITGYIKKINTNEKYILINNKRIYFKDIIDINFY